MKFIDVGDDKYVVQRELPANKEKAEKLRDLIGGTLIQDRSSSAFFLCTKIEDGEYEDTYEPPATDDPRDT